MFVWKNLKCTTYREHTQLHGDNPNGATPSMQDLESHCQFSNFKRNFEEKNVYYQKNENWLGKTPLGYFGEVRCVPPKRGFPWEFLRRKFAGKILPYEPSRKPFPWGYATRGRGGYEGRKVGKQCGLKRYRRGKCILTCINTYFKYEAQFVGRKKTCWCVRLECTFAYMHGSVSLSRTLDGTRQRLEPHSVLQCVAVCFSVRCIVLQRAVVCRSLMQCVFYVLYSACFCVFCVLHWISMLQCFQCVEVRCVAI